AVLQSGGRRADVCARTSRLLYALGVLDNAISLIDADPELADVLSTEEGQRAKRGALARVTRLSPGVWDAAEALERDSHHRGFLVVDGLLSREGDVLGRRCVELIGPSDVLRPWTWDEEGSHVQAEVGWMVLEETAMAVLDHGRGEPRVPPRGAEGL